jgi:hypothetical protein
MVIEHPGALWAGFQSPPGAARHRLSDHRQQDRCRPIVGRPVVDRSTGIETDAYRITLQPSFEDPGTASQRLAYVSAERAQLGDLTGFSWCDPVGPGAGIRNEPLEGVLVRLSPPRAPPRVEQGPHGLQRPGGLAEQWHHASVRAGPAALPFNAVSGNNGYRTVLGLPGWWTWFAVTAPSRLADAGTPLALVLLGHAATGSFATGGVMSGAYALAEAAAAPWSGGRLADRTIRRGGHADLAAALLVRAALFGMLMGAPLPTAALIPITALAGAVAAGTPGSLRTLLVQLADEGPALRRALSLDTVLLELAWTAAPAVVAALATVDPRLAVGGLAVSTALAGLISLRLPVPPGDAAAPNARPRLRSLRPAAMSLLLGLCGGLVGGVLDTAVPPRLVGIGAPATLAGPLFTGYSIISVLTGLAYGARRWPGSPHRQAELLLCGEVLILLPAALVPSLPTVALAVIAAGGCAAPLLTARSLAIRTELPDEALASGFSSLYAVNGLGYGIAGLLVGSLLPAGTALAFTLPLLVILTAVLTLATMSRRRSRQREPRGGGT